MSDQRDLDPLQSAGIALGRREKGKLVGRYRPARRSRNHERKPFRSPPAERGEQLSEAAAFLLAAERESAWDGLDWVRPERDQEGVISERIAGSGADGASARVDRDQRVLDVAGPGVAGHTFELDPQDVGGAERLGNQHGPVDELVRRGQQLDLDEPFGERTRAPRALRAPATPPPAITTCISLAPAPRARRLRVTHTHREAVRRRSGDSDSASFNRIRSP